MLNLLLDCPFTGYPANYLVARIRGRLERVAWTEIPGEQQTGDDSHIWTGAAAERGWLYRQMDETLRKTLAPLFFLFEIETLVRLVRAEEARQGADGNGFPRNTLLSGEIKGIFQGSGATGAKVEQLHGAMKEAGFVMDGLVTAQAENGAQGFEAYLRREFLQQVPAMCGHARVEQFLRTIIDLKNIMTVAKWLRWEKPGVPQLLKGGSAGSKIRSSASLGEALRRMIRRFPGGSGFAGPANPAHLEPFLLDRLGQGMRGNIRYGGPAECVMGYIWHCHAAARHQSRELHAALFAEMFPESMRAA